MKQDTEIPGKLDILDRIKAMTDPLNPPVQAFEASSRGTPFRVLVSVLLSSRTKDAVTLKASQNLFKTAETPEKLAAMEEDHIAQLIFPVGFYKQKAKHLKELGRLLARQGGEVPRDFEKLTALPGVGRKTANLVQSLAFDIPSISVDIHVFRISQRLGWAAGDKPEQVEKQLRESFPPEHWNRINQTLVGFGQTICKPQAPLCGQCTVSAYCPYFLEKRGEKKKK